MGGIGFVLALGASGGVGALCRWGIDVTWLKLEKRHPEAYWVLFRFLYWGQFVDPCLIIAGNYLVGSSVSECLV